jgi:crotonobetainyl-CoA:carnitine CoA-transferase CaiB-like acyl-CoA transferase
VGIEAGGLYGAVAVLAALRKATATGEAQYLDIAEVDCALAFRGSELDFKNNGLGDMSMSGYVRYQYYPTSEGEFVMFMAIEDKFWANFCEAVERPDLYELGKEVDAPGAESDLKARVRQELSDVFTSRTRAEWTEFFIEKNVAGAPAYVGIDVLDDPHISARGLSYEQPQYDGKTMRLFGTPIKVVGQEFAPAAAPAAGADTDAVLGTAATKEN